VSLPKYLQVAARIRAQIASGALLPGAPVPSGAALSRTTGYSTLTCRRALRTLIDDGVLVPGVSRNARPRVAPSAPVPCHRTLVDAARTLSKSLAARRRLAGLTQPEFAKLAGVSVTTAGHAETGRLWQSRRFWERADAVLSAAGELLALHDAYRAVGASAGPDATGETTAANPAADVLPPVAVSASGPVTCVTITWAGGAGQDPPCRLDGVRVCERGGLTRARKPPSYRPNERSPGQ
jgi:Bacterial regulatory proteins, gntR family/Helix-turn-helix domain